MTERTVNFSYFLKYSSQFFQVIKLAYTTLSVINKDNALPRWFSGKESACQCRRCKRCGFDPWVRKKSWRKKWQPTPVFLPGKFHGQRSLVGYSPWSHKELDLTEGLNTHTHTHIIRTKVFFPTRAVVLNQGLFCSQEPFRNIWTLWFVTWWGRGVAFI